jgi:translation initiation factor IF-2
MAASSNAAVSLPAPAVNNFPPAEWGRAARRQKPEPAKPATPKFAEPTTGEIISLKPPIVVRELAEQLKRKPFQIIADLMELNVFASVNQAIDEEIAKKICAKYGFRFEVEKRKQGTGVIHAPVKKVELDIEDKPEDLKLRAPVVTIMGHVDHGKTTLLDVIRKTNVVAGEAGGITQHIGAYTIAFPHPERKNELQQITFLDTPGHAAFSSMRARGANVTDIVVLVVAANDGVMPQTLEALSHAQAAKAEIIVAVNKSDHPNANPMKVRQQLQEKGLVCEEWGGKTLFVDVSALTKQGVDKLLESILLQAEIMELKANPNRRAKGNVIESGLEPGGPTATVLVRKGTLRLGDIVICGQYYGKVRALINEEDKRLKEAGPSVAVKLLGLNGVPEAGLEFSVVENEKEAREEAEKRAMEARALGQEARTKVTLENLFATMTSNAGKVLKIVVKADTQGSVEAIVEALKKIDSDKVSLGSHPQRRRHYHGIGRFAGVGLRCRHSWIPHPH